MTEMVIVNGCNMVITACPVCKTYHGFERHIYETAKQRAEKQLIWCPNGHSWVYNSQKTMNEHERTRLERDRLKQQLAQKDDEIAAAERRAAAAKGQVTRLKKRATAGLCPCCNRHFDNLQRHMASKHKDEVNV